MKMPFHTHQRCGSVVLEADQGICAVASCTWKVHHNSKWFHWSFQLWWTCRPIDSFDAKWPGTFCKTKQLSQVSPLLKAYRIRILFGESYSFDQPEYYATCCRTKTYQEHVALKNYALEHTKPLFNKHNLITLHNLYASRSLVELIKILKLHSPYSVYENLQFCPQTQHFRLLKPKHNLDISKNNYSISSVNLWNKCISKLLDNPDLFSSAIRSHLIIPGHNVNSDLTIPMGTFKNRLKNFLLKTQNLGITSDWSQQNFVSVWLASK